MWLGAILMALGAFTTVLDKRYRRLRVPAPAATASGAVGGA
jgi:cytochrome c biogenesis factor